MNAGVPIDFAIIRRGVKDVRGNGGKGEGVRKYCQTHSSSKSLDALGNDCLELAISERGRGVDGEESVGETATFAIIMAA